MERETRAGLPDSKPEIRADGEEPRKIIGYAVRWNQPSRPIGGWFTEKFQRGAFTSSLVSDIRAYAAWNHDEREVLGRHPSTLTLVEDDVGLRYEIVPPKWAERYLETIERGDVDGSSFIFRAVREEWDESNPDMPVRTVLEAELYEVSPVTTPAYPSSSVGVRSAEDVFKNYQASKRADEPVIDHGIKQRQRERDLHLNSRGF
jgi:HK97 family phage prohead protease